VSLHSCTADRRYIQELGDRSTNGPTLLNINHANHKNICCKKGEFFSINMAPCAWYRMVADAA